MERTFYSESGAVLGYASGVTTCAEVEQKHSHAPHPHDVDALRLNMQMCEGYPKTLLYDEPPRRAVNV